MPKLKPAIIYPTPEEDAQITAQIEADPEDFELDAAWFARAKPASEVFGEEMLRSFRTLRHLRMLQSEETDDHRDESADLSVHHPLG